jgi:glutathione S-transferase
VATKLYGIPGSRALRSIWAIEEVAIDYELVPTHFLGDSKKPEYLRINPNGRIPALVDGDVTLFESMAINLYLAKTYGGDLYPSDAKDEARAVQWSFWGMTELEPPLMQIVLNKFMLPEDQRNPSAVTAAEQAIEKPLAVLDAELASRACLLGGDFSVADLNVASVLSMAGFVGLDVSGFKNVKRWLDACLGRPAFARAQKAGS